MWSMYAVHSRITSTVGRKNCQTDWGTAMTNVMVSYGGRISSFTSRRWSKQLLWWRPVPTFKRLFSVVTMSAVWTITTRIPNIAWLYFCFVSFPLVSCRPIRWATSRWLRSASRQCLTRLLVVSCRTRQWSDSRKIRCKCFGFVFVL